MNPEMRYDGTRRADESLQLLAKATDLLANCTDYEATLDFIASLLVSSLSMWCTIDLLNDDGKIERVAVAHRDPKKADLAREVLLKYPADPSATRGVYKVIETRKPILVPKSEPAMWERRAESPDHLRMILELGSSTFMVVPLIARGRVVGSIMLLSDERTYDEVDLETAEKLARCIALAVDNVYLFRKMQSAQDQLVQSAKLAALGVILAGIAHEVNNPLAIIKGQLKCFEMDLSKTKNPALELFKSYAQKINRNIDRIVKIAQHSKDFSRQSAQQFSKVEIPELVESSLTLFEQQFHLNEISIHKHYLEKDLAILGDFNRLEQVLINIFSNAQDAIQAQPRVGGGNIHITVESVEDDCRITITDDGIGLSSSFKDRVFEPFFTTKDVGRGTGLGLSISHGIIKDHNGRIDFSSAHEKGTKVVIHLPTYQESSFENMPGIFH